MTSEPFDVWITQYALTQGIIHVRAEYVKDHGDGSISVDPFNFQTRYFFAKEWHRSLEAAKEHVDEMRARKIKNLQKQIDRLLERRFDSVIEHRP